MSKLKAVKPIEAKPARPKILIFGRSGIGKTWTSLDFPSPYYIDTEGGANLPHYTKKLTTAGGVYFGPEHGALDFTAVIEQVKALATEKHPYRTLVIDSISKITNTEISKEAERLGEKDAFGASKKPAINKTRQLINWIDRLDMTVLLISHEKAMWKGGEQVGTTFDAYDKLDYELNLCLNLQKVGPERKAFIKKSRFENFREGDSFLWSYENFAKLYGQEIIEADAGVTTLATPEHLARFKELVETVKLDDGQTEKWLTAAKANSFEEMDDDKLVAILDWITKKFNLTTGA